jgi:triacylglycerol lipase
VTIPRLKAPIVLVHGLFGFPHLRVGSWLKLDYFNGLPPALEACGNRVAAAWLSPTRGTAARAAELKAFLLDQFPGEPVHVIAHSMGGLDARYMISKLDMAGSVLSLTTLGTPHRGSPFADWAMGGLVRLVAPLFDMIQLPRDAFHDLTVARCKLFNDETPDMPQVRYYSVAGRYTAKGFHPQWHLSAPIVEKAEGPHDGIVSIASATWGESCEVWDGDHVSLINWSGSGAASRLNDRLPHYSGLMRRLHDEGF